RLRHAGVLVALDTPRRLVEALGEQIIDVRVLGDPAPVATALTQTAVGSRAPLVASGSVTMATNASSGDLADVLGALAGTQAQVVGTPVRRATLNDVYLHLTGGATANTSTPKGEPQ